MTRHVLRELSAQERALIDPDLQEFEELKARFAQASGRLQRMFALLCPEMMVNPEVQFDPQRNEFYVESAPPAPAPPVLPAEVNAPEAVGAAESHQ
jgi:hypothetical protein